MSFVSQLATTEPNQVRRLVKPLLLAASVSLIAAGGMILGSTPAEAQQYRNPYGQQQQYQQQQPGSKPYNYYGNGYGQPPMGQRPAQQPQQQYHPQQQQPQQRYSPPAQNNNYSYEDDSSLELYSQYVEQATNYYNQNQLSKAIEYYSKALPLAQDMSIPVIYNNLAASFISRGVYYMNKTKDNTSALSDFRNALYLLKHGWPDDAPKKPIHSKNLKTTEANLTNTYKRLNISLTDANKHLAMAKEERLKGHFQESIVEYGKVLELNANNAEAQKAMGDLFNVLNKPEKSVTYYSKAADKMGADGGGDEVYVNLGNSLLKANNIDGAVKNYNKALEINPKNMNALNQLEKVWLNEIRFNPSSVVGHANLGSVYQKKGQLPLAYQQYNAAEHFAEQNRSTDFETKKMIRLNMGTLFQAQKNYPMAIKAYDTVLHIDPSNKQANYYKATAYKESGNIEMALQSFDKVLAADPSHTAAQEEMLTMLKQHPDPNRVKAELQRYADRFSRNAIIQSKIGEEFHRYNDYDLAANYYKRAIQLDPNLASAYANLGAVYHAQGNEPESLKAYQKAVELDPSNDTVKELAKSAQQSLGFKHYEQAIALQQQEKHQEAIPAFEKALQTTPDDSDLLSAYGVSLQSVGRIDDAIKIYNKAIAKDAFKANYHYYLGTAYHQQNKLDLAAQAYNHAVTKDPTLAEAREALASIEETQASNTLQDAVDTFNAKKYPQALTLINKAIAAKPTDSLAHYYKGLILGAQNNNTQAAVSYRKSIKLDTGFADAYYALALILDEQNKSAEALTTFKKFIELSPSQDDDFVRYAQDRVKSLSNG